MIRNHFFTLVELIVVIAIVGLLSSIAVTRFRGESPSVMMERVSSEFAAFCTRTRFKALSQGKEYAIVFQPETGTFFAKAMNQNVSWIANKQNDLPEDTESSSNEKYMLPEEFDFVADSLFNQNAADELA